MASKSNESETISKADAIRQTLAEGITSAKEAMDHIKKQYGLDVSRSHFAAGKSHEKDKTIAQETPKRGRPPGKAKSSESKAVEGYLAPPTKPRAVGNDGDILAALEAMKPLVESLGADKVKRLADLLG